MKSENGRRARSTIEDVARMAQVSTATASRVLARSARVSEARRLRVLSAAEALGYRTNFSARALRKNRTSTVGILVPDLSNPFFTLLIDKIEQRLQELEMSVLICSSRADLGRESERLQSLVSSRVDAMIVVPLDAQRSGGALRTAAEDVPLIQVDQFAEGVDADRVGIDEKEGIELLVTHLREQGVRTAAYIGGALTDSSARARFAHVSALCPAHSISLRADERMLGPYSAEWGAQAMRRLLAEGIAPDAILCGADVIALGVLEVLDAHGLSVPRDALVTGFDDIGLSKHPRLSITTVRQPIDDIARQTVELVVDTIGNTTEHEISSYFFRPELVVRASSTRLGS